MAPNGIAFHQETIFMRPLRASCMLFGRDAAVMSADDKAMVRLPFVSNIKTVKCRPMNVMRLMKSISSNADS